MATCQEKKILNERYETARKKAHEARLARTAELRAASESCRVDPLPNTDGLVCWWCVYPLAHLPCLHLPIKFDPRLDKFTTLGNFCSWECMKAYSIDTNSPKAGEVQSFIAVMRRKAYGKYVPLFAAPKRTALKTFGGTMTIDEFRSCYGAPPPPVHFPNDVQIHQVVHDPRRGAFVDSISDQNSKLKAIEDTVVKGEALKLRRNKPLERSKSKLESALGITRKSK
jgi:hypothetical protein